MPAAQSKQPNQKGIVARLARRARIPLDEVAKLYEHEREELAAGARVTTFVDIFAARSVERILRERNTKT
jgi:hypothetical protein